MQRVTFDNIVSDKRYKNAFENYTLNKNIGIKTQDDPDAQDTDIVESGTAEAFKHSNVITVCDKQLLYCQYGGNFPKMRFCKADMSDVNCEILACYNALKFSDYINDSGFEEFFKIAAELEVNAPYVISTGHFGADHKKLGEFLKSRDVPFTVHTDPDKATEALKVSKCAIVAYKFDMVKIHTFMCFYENGKVVSVNRGSGCLYLWKNESIIECLKGGKLCEAYILT